MIIDMIEEDLNCPFCGSHDLNEKPGIVGVDYSEKEHTIYKCLSCGRIFDEREMLEEDIG